MIEIARPLLRGYLHLGAAILSVFAGAYLVLLSHPDPPRLASVLVYAGGVTFLFSVSAVYHVRAWGLARARVLRRLDHAAIFLLIAATYTPVAVNLLSGTWRVALLATVWTLAGIGAAIAVAGVQLPRGLRVAIYVALGWLGPVAFGQIDPALPSPATAALVAGGVLYTLGAVLYALRWPDPWPRVFGYHEIFHVLTIVAAACFYALIAVYVAPAPRG
ncbi:MAG TPA: hemolysin III family protein [Candidatus Limnocylindria bacterium]|nr:hemolysin III family protein [Candidatus Limnocylindria bacterium]